MAEGLQDVVSPDTSPRWGPAHTLSGLGWSLLLIWDLGGNSQVGLVISGPQSASHSLLSLGNGES